MVLYGMGEKKKGIYNILQDFITITEITSFILITNFCLANRLTDTENKLMLTRGERWGGG